MDAGGTLLDFLARRFRYHDRETWLAKVAEGAIRVDGRSVSPSHRLTLGMSVTYETEHREPDVCTEVPVLSERGELLLVDKPAGLPVHADGVFVRNTLVHVLRSRLGPEVYPLHRLDRETSGVLALATSRAAARALQPQFERGEVEKSYLAVVRGLVAGDRLTCTAPIGCDSSSKITIRRCAGAHAAGAREARTEVNVRTRLATTTVVEAVPRTGRTHQIRVHLAAAGHPLVGDVLYGRTDAEYLAWVQHVKAGGDPGWPQGRDMPRHLLHARSLTLRGPDGERVEVEAPQPADFSSWIARDERR